MAIDVSKFGKRTKQRQVTKPVEVVQPDGMSRKQFTTTMETYDVYSSHLHMDEAKKLQDEGVEWTPISKGQWTTSYGDRRFILNDDEYKELLSDKSAKKPAVGMAKDSKQGSGVSGSK